MSESNPTNTLANSNTVPVAVRDNRYQSWLGYVLIFLAWVSGLAAMIFVPYGQEVYDRNLSTSLFLTSRIVLLLLLPVTTAQWIVFSEQLDGKRLSAWLCSIVFLELSYVGSCWWMRNIGGQLLPPDSLFLWVPLSGVFSCAIVFAAVRRIAPALLGPKRVNQSKKQFSLFSVFLWTTLIGALLGIGISPRSDELLQAAIVAGIYLAATLFVVIPISIWLMRVRPFLLAALTLVVFTFVGVLVGLCVDSALSARGDTESKMATLFLATFIAIFYSAWTLGVRLVEKTQPVVPASSNRGRISRIGLVLKRVCFAISIGFCLYVAGWLVLHFGVRGENRNFDLLDNASVVRTQLETCYQPDVVAAVASTCDSGNLLDLLNALNSHGVDPEDNVVYRLARISKIQFYDREVFDSGYWGLLGLTAAEFEALPDHNPVAWLAEKRPDKKFYDYRWVVPDEADEPEEMIAAVVETASNQRLAWTMLSSPWTEVELPLAAEYCQSKQDVFQAIRDAADCPKMFYPLEKYSDDSIFTFAREMLTIDSSYQIGRGNLDGAIDNCEAIWKLASLMEGLPIHSPFALAEKRMRANATDTSWVIASHPQCTTEQANRIQKLMFGQSKFLGNVEKRLCQSLVIRLAGAHDLHIEADEYYSSTLLHAFAGRHAQTVDWSNYIESTCKHYDEINAIFEQTDGLSANYQRVKSYTELMESRMDLMDRFECQVWNMMQAPKPQGRLLAEMDDADSRYLDLELLCVAKTRLFLSEVAVAREIYRHRHGRYPDSLFQLAPEIMPSTPIDPYSNKPLMFCKSKDGFVLYSTGRDGQDDGGDNESDVLFHQPSQSLGEYLKSR